MKLLILAMLVSCDGNTTRWSHIFPGYSTHSHSPLNALDGGVDAPNGD